MGTTKTLLTFEEFERLPDQPGKCELLKGELVELPPAELRHARIGKRSFLRLHTALEAAHRCGEAPELGEVFMETGYKLANDSYVIPDVSITHAGQAEAKYLGGAPAIAIEIISPSNTAEQLLFKTKLYFQFGAREVWWVNYKTRCFIVHVPGKSHEVGEDESITTPLLPGLALSVGEILGD